MRRLKIRGEKMSKTNILNKVENQEANRFFILAKALQIIFISYGINENKTLKLQLKTLFHCMDEEKEAEINNLINSYDPFNENNWDWFKQQAFNLINKKLW